MLTIGPRFPRRSVDRGLERVWNRPYVLTDLMVSIANLLAFDFEVPEKDLKPD